MRRFVLVGLVVVCAACGNNDVGGDDDQAAKDASPTCTTDLQCTSASASFCGDDGQCRGCVGDGECATRDPSAPLCADDGVCVACRTSADCAASAPICDDEDRACRGCSADKECASGVCDREEGRCIDASQTYVVDDDAACGAGDGSAASPFCSINEALTAYATTPRNFVVVRAGAYQFPAQPLAQALLPAFIGHDATIGPSTTGADCLTLATPAQLFVRGFDFVGCGIAANLGPMGKVVRFEENTVTGGTAGVQCRAPLCLLREVTVDGATTGVGCGAAAHCVLEGVRVANAKVGIVAEEATMEINGGEVSGASQVGVRLTDSESLLRGLRVTGGGTAAGAAGIACEGGFCTIERTQVMGVGGVGLFVTNAGPNKPAQFEVFSSVFADNGTTSASALYAGGIFIHDAGPTRAFANNTVVRNRAPAGQVAGVRCGVPVALRSSIVWGNGGSPLDGACTATYSLFDATVTGTGNLNADPKLVSLTPGAMDAHLAADSPCIDQGDPAGGPAQDLDGQARNNGRVDIGADELSP